MMGGLPEPDLAMDGLIPNNSENGRLLSNVIPGILQLRLSLADKLRSFAVSLETSHRAVTYCLPLMHNAFLPRN